MICQGIDVSHFDGIIDWAKVKGSGISFAFIKATEGSSFKDLTFSKNWNSSKAAGILSGAYHFFHASEDPQKQAEFFLNTMGKIGMGDLPPVLDWELHGGTRQQEIANALMWLEMVKSQSGKTPIIYCGRYFIGDLGNPIAVAAYPLWLAEYNPEPHVPKPWSQYTFWQYSEKGSVPGISGKCDLNKGLGDDSWLQSIANGS